MKFLKVLTVALAGLTPLIAFSGPLSATSHTYKVYLEDMATSFADVLSDPSRWLFYNDETNTIDNTLGSFVSGPDVTPEGNGSIQISVSGTQRRNLATYQFAGTPLDEITTLAYSTYNSSAGNSGSVNRSGYLHSMLILMDLTHGKED